MGVLKRQHNRNVIIPQFYNASDIWRAKTVSVAGDRLIILSPLAGEMDIGNKGFYWDSQVSIDISVAANWDAITPTNYTTAANRAGKDVYIYACRAKSGSGPKFLLSPNSTYPSGYTADNSRKVAGFHCLCADVKHTGATGSLSYWAANTAYVLGQTIKDTADSSYIYRCTTAGTSHLTTEPTWTNYNVDEFITDNSAVFIKELHGLEGYAQGDILPSSVWCLDHRPIASPEGLVWIPSVSVWAMIYSPTGTWPNLTWQYNGTVAHSLTLRKIRTAYMPLAFRLPNRCEFIGLAIGSNVNTTINGGADPSLTGGHSDAYGRRLVSSMGCEDCCGAHAQVLTDLTESGKNWFTGGKYNSGVANIGYDCRADVSISLDSDLTDGIAPRGVSSPRPGLNYVL